MAVSFKDRAYQHIRSKILCGGFSEGDRLSEEALATEIGISRTPVREALNRLASEGLAKQLPHYGVFVRKFERDELVELYDLRVMLECYAAGCAATRRSDEELAEAQTLCDGLRDVAREFQRSGATDLTGPLLERQVQLDVQFHASILRAADCPLTMKVASDLRLLTQVCGRKRFLPGENLLRMLAKTVREHTALVGALRRRDVAAARFWMSRHLERGKAEGLAAFDRRQLNGAGSKSTRGQADSLEHYGLIEGGSAKPRRS